MRCVYNDSEDRDHDALVLREHADGSRDLVIAPGDRPIIVEHVPPRSARIIEVEVPKVSNRRGVVVQPAMRLPKRWPGAFWRD